MGRKAGTVRWRVTGHEPPRRSTFETYESSMLKPSGVITVAPSGDGSKVTFEMEPNPIDIAKLVMPMIARQIRKNITTDLDRSRAEPRKQLTHLSVLGHVRPTLARSLDKCVTRDGRLKAPPV